MTLIVMSLSPTKNKESTESLIARFGLPQSTSHIKSANKNTALRDLQRTQTLHYDKLSKMGPSIDMRKPKSMAYEHVKVNAKRQQVETERNADIERENKILLGKMYTIMNAEPAYKTDKGVSVTSLNMTVRKQEYDRIARENQAIMQRILKREPNFNRGALDADWKVTQRYLHNISEFPFILGQPLPPAIRKKTLKPIDLEGGEPVELEAPPEGEAAALEAAISGDAAPVEAAGSGDVAPPEGEPAAPEAAAPAAAPEGEP